MDVLRENFLFFYRTLAEIKIHPDAIFEKTGKLYRCFSGIKDPYQNIVLGEDHSIQEQVDFFRRKQVPFVWYFDEGSSPILQEKLLKQGFKDEGIYQGVISRLNFPIPFPNLPSDCSIELVQSPQAMKDWVELVCKIFEMENVKESYQKAMWQASKQAKFFHWLVRKKEKPLSALTTVLEKNVVSFWNGSTLPELRKQGLATALRYHVLKHAIDHGCQIGTSYLQSDALAKGIYQKLGYETKWRFHVYEFS